MEYKTRERKGKEGRAGRKGVGWNEGKKKQNKNVNRNKGLE